MHVTRYPLVGLSLLLGALFPAHAVDIRGEATLDVRARTGYGGSRLSVYEARGSLQAPIGRRWELYADAGVREGEGIVAESYAEYRAEGTRLRLGRFYLPIGIHSRSELYYTGFVELPFVKYWPFGSFVAFRSEQGLAVAGGSPRLGYQLGLLGGDGSEGLLGLDDPRETSLRLQGAAGRLILGVNGYAGSHESPFQPDGGERAARLFGLDWRYSTPGWIVRGEYWTGRTGGRALDGGYVDLLYHPEALPAWTLVLRGEVVRWGRTARLGTIGTRYVPAAGWAIHVNWIAENADYGSKGLHLQLLRGVEF